MSTLVWPRQLLMPARTTINPVPFTRSGGRSLGGIEPATRTDRGYWSIGLEKVELNTRAQRQAWSAIRTALSGSSGLIAIPIWSFSTAPFASGSYEPVTLTTHGDGATFGDGSQYRQGAIAVRMADAVAIGATSVRLEIVHADANLVGVRFSHDHALYETGPATLVDGDTWTVPITPAARAAIPAGADLEFDEPTCLCRLAEDNGMDASLNNVRYDTPSVAFVEAVDYWSDLAAGLI